MHLDQREREIIVLRFYYDQTQSQIAKDGGISGTGIQAGEADTQKNEDVYLLMHECCLF